MTIDDRITNEKLQHNINRKAAKLSALSSAKIDKYEYFTDEEINSNYRTSVVYLLSFTKNFRETNKNSQKSR